MWMLVAFLAVWPGGIHGKSLEQVEFWENQKKLIDALALAATERIKEAQNTENWESDCAYHECGWTFENNRECWNSNAPNYELKCDSGRGGCTPIGVFPDRAFVTTPPGVNPDALDDATSGKLAVKVAKDIRVLQGLEGEGAYKNAIPGNKKEFSGWAFLGTTSGVSFSSPGRASDRLAGSVQGSSCPQYDPRLRPWYGPAISPKRFAIFLVDTSVVSIANQTMEAILSTLSISDQIAMIPYSVGYNHPKITQDNNRSSKNRLTYARIEGKKKVKMEFENKPATDLWSAMKQAFEMLKNVPSGVGDKIIFYISGPEVGAKTSRDVLEYIEKKQNNQSQVHFITFTFDSQENSGGFARKLACKHKGVWTKIVDSGLPKMDNYFLFIALAAEHAQVEPQGPHFSEIYLDAGFLGNVMTTSKAFFEKTDCQKGRKRILRGVAGIDTQVSESRNSSSQGSSESARMGMKLNLRTTDVKDLECQLQIIRGLTETQCPGILKGDHLIVRTDKEYYVFHNETNVDFENAVKECDKAGGKLAVVDSVDKQNLLSSLALDTGSWVCLSSNQTECSPTNLPWSPSFTSKMNGCSMIDNRGALDNTASAPCKEERTFFCEFSGFPGGVQGSHISLLKNTPEVCKAQNECSPEKVGGNMTSKPVFCNLGEKGSGLSPDKFISPVVAMCCEEEKAGVCPVEEPIAKGNPEALQIDSEVLIASVVPLIVVGIALFVYMRRRRTPPPRKISKDILDGSTIIGVGASGTVKKGRDNDQDVAVKVFKIERRQDFEAELEIYQKLPPNQNIIKLLGIQDESSPDNTDGEVCLVLELMEMNLKEYLEAGSGEMGFTYRTLLKIFLDIASGLEHLHKNKVIHRDIKPQNVLINEHGDDCIAKLCDFGHSKNRIRESVTLTGIRGTRGYMSPELFQMFYNADGEKVKVSSATDIYSLGVLMCECIVGSEAFFSEPTFPEMPENMRELIKKCRQYIDTERPKASEVCSQLRSFLQSRWASHRVSRWSSVQEQLRI